VSTTTAISSRTQPTRIAPAGHGRRHGPRRHRQLPSTPNPSQADLDGDGFGNACDGDADGDGDPLGSDCDDLDPRRSTLKAEDCTNVIDDDCDAFADLTDPDCANWDSDGDTSATSTTTAVSWRTPARRTWTAPLGDACDPDVDGDRLDAALGDCNDRAPGEKTVPTEVFNCSSRSAGPISPSRGTRPIPRTYGTASSRSDRGVLGPWNRADPFGTPQCLASPLPVASSRPPGREAGGSSCAGSSDLRTRELRRLDTRPRPARRPGRREHLPVAAGRERKNPREIPPSREGKPHPGIDPSVRGAGRLHPTAGAVERAGRARPGSPPGGSGGLPRRPASPACPPL